MWYYVLMLFLIAGSAGMIGWTWKSVKNEKRTSFRRQKKSREEDLYEEDPREQDPYVDRRERRPRRDRDNTGSGKKRRQWKIILEDVDTWEKYSFIFYDSVGIGRVKDKGAYDRFLEIRDDKRVSKVHCAIIHRGDQLYLKDEGSRNGTYLNGDPVTRPVLIEKEDLIEIGGTRLEIRKILRESE